MSQEQDYMERMDKYFSKRQKIKEYMNLINVGEIDKVNDEIKEDKNSLINELSNFKKEVEESINSMNNIANTG